MNYLSIFNESSIQELIQDILTERTNTIIQMLSKLFYFRK